MQMKPIEGAAKNIVIILVVGCCLGIANSFLEGEIHAWRDYPRAADHAGVIAVGMAFAWIAMKSPWSGTFRTLVGSLFTTSPSGQVQEMKVEASIPTSAGPATMTINPNTQQITVKEGGASANPADEQKGN